MSEETLIYPTPVAAGAAEILPRFNGRDTGTMTEEVKTEILLRMAAISMESDLNRLVEIGQATRDEQGRYTLNIAPDNRDIIRRLLGLPG